MESASPTAPRRRPRRCVSDGVLSLALEQTPDANAQALRGAKVVLIGVKPAMVPELLASIVGRPGTGCGGRQRRGRRHDRDDGGHRPADRCSARCRTPRRTSGAASRGSPPGTPGDRGGRRRWCARCSRPSAPSSRCPRRRSTPSARSPDRVRPTCSSSSSGSPRPRATSASTRRRRSSWSSRRSSGRRSCSRRPTSAPRSCAVA